AHILGMGLLYILGIYLTYFLIGMGILKSFIISDSPFIVGKIAATVVIALGIINLIGILFPRFPIRLKIPKAAHSAMEKYMEKASLPAAFILGVRVGLCAFPCSGGVYVAILGLLGAKATYLQGVGYLALYNFMFVLLLLVVLLLATNRKTLDKIADMEASNSKTKRLAASLFMILLGVGIWIWII
ncbi:MAG: cytochrome c biogenesis protein CcdA, partial [Patescibacteria group bacterium]